MKFLDERGKLFGIINLIDLAVVLLLVFLAAGVYYKSERLTEQTPLTTTPITMEFLALDVPEVVAGQIKAGDGAWDRDTNSYLGKIIKVEVRPAQMMTPTADGKQVLAQLPTRQDVLMTIQGEGQVSESDVRLGRRDVRAGLTIFMNSQSWMVRGIFQQIKW